MRPFEQRLSDLLLDVYESAASPQHWPAFLEKAARELDAQKVALHVHYFAAGDSIKTSKGSCAVAIGYDATSLVTYADHYAPLDIYVQRIRERFPLGMNAGTSEDLVTTGEFRNSEIYQDYCRQNEVFHTCWSAFEQTSGIAAGLGFIRPESSKAFQREDVTLLKLLNPHLAKAFRLQRIIEHATTGSKTLLTSSAHFDFGVIALDEEGRIINLSAPAKYLLDQLDGIRVHAARLEAIHADENQKLQKLLNNANLLWAESRQAADNSMLISRNSGRRPLQLVVYPFVSRDLLAGNHLQILVFLSDPESKPVSRATVLMNLYGLTPAEARLSDLLLEGLELREAADRLRTTLETARFHLKRVLAKTGTHRQTELMRLMLSLPGRLDELRLKALDSG